MSRFERVLSIEQISTIVQPVDWSANKDLQMAAIVAREIEQAVLAKLAEQEPVAYAVFAKNGSVTLWTKGHAESIKMGGYIDAEMTPLYAHPMPAIKQEPVAWFTEDHLTDRSATTYDPAVRARWEYKGWPISPLYTHPCDPQNGKYEAQIPDGTLINEGTKGQHRSIDNHIPDGGQMIPEGWRLVPKEPTDDMYLGFCHVRNDIEPDQFREAYRAMLAAAPKYDGGSHD